MTESHPRRRWPIVAAVVAATVLLVVVIVALTAGGDDDAVAGATTAATASGAPGSTVTAANAQDDASTSDPASATSTVPGVTAAPTPTTAAGDVNGSAPPADPGDTADAPTDDPTPTNAPSPGSLVTVPTGTVVTADPIPPDEVGEFGTGVTAEIVTIEAVEGVAQAPGEISGPAVRVRVRLTNGSDDAINLSRVLVDVTYGPDRTPGLALAQPGGDPFIGELASGRAADGVYVFGVPVEARGQVQIHVSYDVNAPFLVFEGPAPRA